MDPAALLVVGGGLVALALLAWHFFGPKKAGLAELRAGTQEVTITVKGGYDPAVVRVRRASRCAWCSTAGRPGTAARAGCCPTSGSPGRCPPSARRSSRSPPNKRVSSGSPAA